MSARQLLGLVVLACSLVSCGTTSRRINPALDDEVGGGGIESGDVLAMADQCARDILGDGRFVGTDPRPIIYMSALRNDTATVIDKEIILTKLRTALVRHGAGRVRVIDRSKEGLESVRAERKAKREGAVTNQGEKGLLGADFVLKGTIKGIEKRRKDMRSTFYLITAEMVDLESSELLWTKDYQFKWVGDRSAIYQ